MRSSREDQRGEKSSRRRTNCAKPQSLSRGGVGYAYENDMSGKAAPFNSQGREPLERKCHQPSPNGATHNPPLNPKRTSRPTQGRDASAISETHPETIAYDDVPIGWQDTPSRHRDSSNSPRMRRTLLASENPPGSDTPHESTVKNLLSSPEANPQWMPCAAETPTDARGHVRLRLQSTVPNDSRQSHRGI